MQIELNKIYNMDCIEGMASIPTGSVDLILCDLPYGITRNPWDAVIPLDKMWEQYLRITKDNAPIVLTAMVPFDKVLGVSKIELLKCEWIWQKVRGTGFLNAKKYPLKMHENILVFCKSTPTYNPQMKSGKSYTLDYSKKKTTTNYGKVIPREDHIPEDITTRYPGSILTFPYDVEKLHPTQKPVNLFEYLIKTYSNEGDTVLDNCMGSGTTAIASMKSKRNFIGFELDPKNYQICLDRIAQLRHTPTLTELFS